MPDTELGQDISKLGALNAAALLFSIYFARSLAFVPTPSHRTAQSSPHVREFSSEYKFCQSLPQ